MSLSKNTGSCELRALTGVLASDGRLVADGGDVGAAVTRSLGHVKVDRETVHSGSGSVHVVELFQERNTAMKNGEIVSTL